MSEFETKPGVKLPTPEDNRPKRFYKNVTVEASEDSWLVLLDGRTVKSPAKNALTLPTKATAELVAEEWAAQGERIDPPLMPATRMAFVTLDYMAMARVDTIAEVAKYASTDLLCFRAPEPDELIAAQAAAWDPLLDWADKALGARLIAVTGVVPVDQDAMALQAFFSHAETLDNWKLTATAHATAVCGSAILGCALQIGEIDGDQAFALSTLDEAFQTAQWGEDEDAAERSRLLREELVTVDRWLRALSAPEAG